MTWSGTCRSGMGDGRSGCSWATRKAATVDTLVIAMARASREWKREDEGVAVSETMGSGLSGAMLVTVSVSGGCSSVFGWRSSARGRRAMWWREAGREE